MPNLPDAETVTELFKAIAEIIKGTAILLKTPEGIAVFIVILLVVIRYLGAFRLPEILGRPSRTKARALEKYLADTDGRDQACLAILRDLSDADHFQLATKIYAEKLRRDALINLHSHVQHKVTWTGIRRALQYFEYDRNGNATVRPFTFFEKFGHWCNQIIAILSLLFAVGLFSMILIMQLSHLQGLVLVAGIFLAVTIGSFSLFQTLPEHFAKRIAMTLAEENSEPE